MSGQLTPPTVTVPAVSKLEPDIVSSIPPAVVPEDGVTTDTKGPLYVKVWALDVCPDTANLTDWILRPAGTVHTTCVCDCETMAQVSVVPPLTMETTAPVNPNEVPEMVKW